jgi:hypothetical protein
VGVFKELVDFTGIGGDYDHASVVGCFRNDFCESFLRPHEIRTPVRCSVRPGEKNAVLFLPFGWISDGAHDLRKISGGKEGVK